jgi:hypothetical protein
MHFRNDPEKHTALIEELLDIFKERGFQILAADSIGTHPMTHLLHNDGYGDQEDKAPDIYAYDGKRHCCIIGEAKTGNGDFETEHALTQYNVFLDQFDKTSGLQADLYIIVPAAKLPEFNTLITHYIHPKYLESIVVVSSKTQQD